MGSWRLNLTRQTTAVFALLAILVASVFGALVAGLQQTRASTDRARHAHDVLERTAETERLIVDLETGLRGFQLTGRAHFLEPWTAARAQLPREFATLRALTAGDADASARLAALERRVDRYISGYGIPLVSRRALRPAPRSVIRTAEQGKRRVDAMRAAVASFRAEQDADATALQAHATAARQRLVLVGIVGLVGTLLLIVGLAVAVRRRIATPLRAVLAAMDRLRAGDRGVRVGARYSGEVGRLAEGFDAMASSIEAHDRRASAAAARMERVVAAQRELAGAGGTSAEVMAAVCRLAQDLTGAAGAVVATVEDDALVTRASTGGAGAGLDVVVPLEGSLIGRCARHAEALLCRDAHTDPRVDRVSAERMGARSFVAVPLQQGDEVLAVLEVLSPEPEAFGADDRAALQLLAGGAGAAVARSRAARVAAAHEAVSVALATATDPADGMAEIVAALARTLEWDAVALWQPSDAGDLHRTVSWARPGTDVPRPDVLTVQGPTGGSPLGRAFATREPVWLDDDAMAGLTGGLAATSAGAAIPAGEFGVFGFLAARPRAMDAETPAAVERVAPLLGQYVARAEAERRLRAEARNLSVVLTAAGRMAQAQTTGEAHELLCDAVHELTDAALVWLMERRGDKLVCVAAGADIVPEVVVSLGREPSGAARVATTGRPLFVRDTTRNALVSQRLREATGTTCAHFQPITRDDRVEAVLATAWSHPVDSDDPALAGIQLLAVEAAGVLDRLALLKRLDDAARTDALTGLPNRRSWDEELPEALARARRADEEICVALVDLDHFKAYNDARGHQAGDQLLREAAARWSDQLRATDLIARYGGEEFAVVLPGCALADGEALMDRLRGVVPGGQSCSIGIAVWDGSETPDDVVARADRALYGAKAAGRDRVLAATPA